MRRDRRHQDCHDGDDEFQYKLQPSLDHVQEIDGPLRGINKVVVGLDGGSGPTKGANGGQALYRLQKSCLQRASRFEVEEAELSRGLEPIS